MASGEIHIGDIGTRFIVTVRDGEAVCPLELATTLQIIFKRPDKQLLTKTATLVTDGSDGQIQYTTIAGDLSQAGAWSFQARIVSPAGEWHSDIQPFTIYPNL